MKVALISMPFASLYRPPIGLSILKSVIEEQGYSAKIFPLNIRFGEILGIDSYNTIIGARDEISDCIPFDAFFGEWLFSKILFEKNSHDSDAYYAWLKSEGLVKIPKQFHELAENTLQTAKQFILDSAKAILAYEPNVIGFSCTFQQVIPSLCLAKLIKESTSTIPILFGGASCAGDMGRTLLHSFSEIDGVCTGEGEVAFPKFLFSIANLRWEPIAGLILRTPSGEILDGGELEPFRNVDQLPLPDYSDYFDGLNDEIFNNVRLQYEASRGCWWGAKHHCTFCGQNANGMKYGSKSPEKVHAEINALSKMYGIRTIEFCDNILDMGYFKTLLPSLKLRWPPLRLFFEIKSNLTREQVKLLEEAGVYEVQPGIESLSSEMLTLMRKGVSGAQNIALLKWMKLYGVKTYWNLLGGFPGESIKPYKWMKQIIPQISHFEPPQSVGAIRIDRFSPYHAQPANFSIKGLRPYQGYKFIYPKATEEFIKGVAYHFEMEGLERTTHEQLVELAETCDQWKNAYTNESDLRLKQSDGKFTVLDSRPLMTMREINLTYDLAITLMHFDKPRRWNHENYLGNRNRWGNIDQLFEDNLIIEDGGWIISLVSIDDNLMSMYRGSNFPFFELQEV